MAKKTVTTLVAPPLDEYRDRAREAVARHYDDLVLRASNRTATQRAMDVYKVVESNRVLSGQKSDLLTEEAAVRGVSPVDLAKSVLGEAKKLERYELERVAFNKKLADAKDHLGVLSVLRESGAHLTT